MQWLVRAAIGGAVAGLVGAVALQGSLTNVVDAAVERMVDDRAMGAAGNGPISAGITDKTIETYLVRNPQILERMADALGQMRDAERRKLVSEIVAANHDIIIDGEGAVSIGNPAGNVTLVEFYDYNCGFCRSTLPDIATLLAEDSNLRIVLRQFPILSSGSLDAAKVGTLLARDGADYWSFHQALFTARGQVDLETAVNAAVDLGLDGDALRARLEEPEVNAAIAETRTLADQMGISGTPSFVLADEVIAGAVGIDVLREKIGNVRKCGSTRCPGPSTPVIP